MRRCTTLAAFVLTAALTFAAEPKISKELKNADPNATVDVVVQYKVQPTSEHFAKAHSFGATDKRIYTKVPQAAFIMTAAAAAALANDPDVKYVSIDRKVKSHDTTTTGLAVTGLAINANLVAQMGYDGAGIGVALIDSGVAPDDQDLQAVSTSKLPAAISPKAQGSLPEGKNYRVIYAQDFTQPNQPNYQLQDQYGHGTHVAGIIAGNGSQSTGNNYTQTFEGIAPNANIISLRVLDENGEGSDSEVIAAIDQAIVLKNTYNIRIMNLSLGRPVYESFVNDPLCQAVEQAWQAGILVVVAAGNDGRDDSFNENGYGTIDAPGNDPYVLTVGAMNAAFTATRIDDQVTTYSSKGPTPVDHIVKPDLMAPGNNIPAYLQHGTLVNEYPANVVSPLLYKVNAHPTDASPYFTLNGTSMAAGVVSGAAALLLEAQPNLTPDQAKAILMLTASKNFNNFGLGYFNTQQDALQMQVNISTAQFTLPQAQQSVQQAQNQLTNDQNKLSQDTSHEQQDAAIVAADQKALTAAQNAVVSYQTAYNNAVTTYNNAVAAQNTAQTNFSNAQAALVTAQRAFQGNSSQVQTAQANLQSAQNALQTAQQSTNTAQQAMNQAQNTLQNAQNTVQQAQNQLANDQQKVAQDNAQLAQDNATVAADNAKLTTANAPIAQLAAWQAELNSDNATAAAMQESPSSYPAAYDIFTVGAGYLDINAAVTNTNIPPAGQPALSPVAYVDPTSGNILASGSYAVLCGNPALGGTSAAPLSGSAMCSDSSIASANALWVSPAMGQASATSSTVTGNQTVWGAQSIWGAAVLGNNQTIGGAQSIWGAQTVWGAQSIWGASGTSAYQTLWGAQSIWGADTSGASSTDNAFSEAMGDPGL